MRPTITPHETAKFRNATSSQFKETDYSIARAGAIIHLVGREKPFTESLAVGTQSRFIKVAKEAADRGCPINILLTVRWNALYDNEAEFACHHASPIEKVRYSLELIRKWLTKRTSSLFYFWVQENSSAAGIHWHLALHLPDKLKKPFGNYCADLFGAPIEPPALSGFKTTKGELFVSEGRAWHLAEDLNHEKSNVYLAAYLGKGEPSQVSYRGVMRVNKRKPYRTRKNGGFGSEDKKWCDPQGKIDGKQKDRFGICRSLASIK